MESATDLTTEHDLANRPRRSRVSISLTGDALAAVEEISDLQGVPEGEVVRRAIKLLHYVNEELAKGSVFRMQPVDGEPERITILY